MFKLMGKRKNQFNAHKISLSGPRLKVHEDISTFDLVHVFAYKVSYMRHISLTKCTCPGYIVA